MFKCHLIYINTVQLPVESMKTGGSKCGVTNTHTHTSCRIGTHFDTVLDSQWSVSCNGSEIYIKVVFRGWTVSMHIHTHTHSPPPLLVEYYECVCMCVCVKESKRKTVWIYWNWEKHHAWLCPLCRHLFAPAVLPQCWHRNQKKQKTFEVLTRDLGVTHQWWLSTNIHAGSES